ncbi:MAG: hypothetical protein M3303_10050 [Gemmatimonadota bacterium]|nr:hypothetical protein [Gemmatimonadota bacterium]
MTQLTRIPAGRCTAAVGVLAAAVLFTPVPARAQQESNDAGRWRVEPTVGLWRQLDRGAAAGRRVGPFVGLQVSQQRGRSARVTASAGYHRLDDALEIEVTDFSGQSRTDVYDAEIVSVTVGATGDVGQGDAAAVAVGFEAGAGWNRDRFDRSIGSVSGPFAQPPTIDDWTPVFLATPSLAWRRPVGTRVELTATGRVLLAFGDISPSTIPTLATGLAYRF